MKISFKNYVVVDIFFWEIMFSFKTKKSTGQLSCLALQLSSSERCWWISPLVNSTFPSFAIKSVPPIASCQCMTNDCGCVWSSESQTLRQALTLSMSFYKYQSAIGGEKEREKLVFVYMVYYQLRGSYTVLVCGGGDFFKYRLNVKNTRATFFPYFYVHINRE